MILGGITSAFVGSAISKRIDNRGVEKVLKVLMMIIIAINCYNAIKFICLI